MDQIKIGKFIARQRKSKSLTQKQLAEQLNISDKTISKWETGKGFPEISLMVPLCEALDINVNELVSGEILSENTYKEKAENNIINLVKEIQEKDEIYMNKIKKISKALNIVFIILIVVLLIYFILSIFFNPNGELKFSSENFSITSGFIRYDVEYNEWGPIEADTGRNLFNTIYAGINIIFILFGVNIIRKLFKDLGNGEPFSMTICNNLKKLSWFLLVFGIVGTIITNLNNIIPFVEICNALQAVEETFDYAKVEWNNITAHYVPEIQWGYFAAFALLMLLSHIFSYGKELEQITKEEKTEISE